MNYRYLGIALALSAIIVGCTENMEIEPMEEQAIFLNVGLPQTRAMLDQDALGQNGNRIKVYDFVTSGTTTTKHIDSHAGPDVTSSSSMHLAGKTWPFTDEMDGTTADSYQWIPGSHKFFGWLAKDASFNGGITPQAFFGTNFTFNETQMTLTVPHKQITAQTDQFDFMYSNIHITEPISGSVAMQLNHLFTAVSFGIINDGKSEVVVNEYKATLYTQKSASISFATAETIVAYTTGTSGQPAVFRSRSNFTVPALTKLPDAFNATSSSSSANDYKLMWPQEANELKACKLSITYTKGNTTYSKTLDFPVERLEAGKKYHFNVMILDTQNIRVNYMVVDWDDITNDYTFE